MRLNVLSLFAGIGGLEFGLERAGMTTVGQVELDPYCRRVLARHWPEVPRHDDVRTTLDWWTTHSRPRVDLVVGGYPCPAFSQAARGRNVAADLWPAMRGHASTDDVRADDGLPDRMDRLRTLGNAVVPQVAEHIARLIVADAETRTAA